MSEVALVMKKREEETHRPEVRPFRLKHTSTSNIDIGRRSKCFPRNVNKSMQVCPFRDVAFMIYDVRRVLYELLGFGSERNVSNNNLCAQLGSTLAELCIDSFNVFSNGRSVVSVLYTHPIHLRSQ